MVTSWFWFLLVVAASPDFFLDFGISAVLGVSGLSLGIAWGIQTIRRPSLLSTHRWKWLSVPLIGVLSFLFFTDLGLVLRLTLFQDSLKNAARNAAPERVDETPRWIGLFSVMKTDEINGAVYFYTGYGVHSERGIAYIPRGYTRPFSRMGYPFSYRHLFGPWYKFSRAGYS